MTTRYTVIASRAWRHTSGMIASLYGAVPWTTEAEAANWKVFDRGFTVRNEKTGTVGIGRVPWETEAEAQAWVDKENARMDACNARIAAQAAQA